MNLREQYTEEAIMKEALYWIDKLKAYLGEAPCLPLASVSIQDNLRSALGKCSQRGGTFHLIINGKFLEYNDGINSIRSTIAHECCHMMPDGFNHGPTWKYYGGILKNFHPELRISTQLVDKTYLNWLHSRDCEQNKKIPKYMLKCKKCGHEYFKYRYGQIIANPELYHCGKCGGDLDLFVRNDLKTEENYIQTSQAKKEHFTVHL